MFSHVTRAGVVVLIFGLWSNHVLGSTLYYFDYDDWSITGIDVDTGDPVSVIGPVLDSVGRVKDIAIDPLARKVYWTDYSYGSGAIARANLDGSGEIEYLIGEGSPNPPAILPIAITVDPFDQKMYWSHRNEPFPEGIWRSDLDGTNPEKVIHLESGGDVELDLRNGKIYWAELGRVSRANLDGSQSEAIFTGPMGDVSLALDTAAEKIYWTRAIEMGVDGGIVQRANLDGSDLETLVTGLDLYDDNMSYIDLDLPAGKMYFSGGYFDNIFRANLDGTQIEDLGVGQYMPAFALYVPEPSTLTLIVIALVSLLLVRLRPRPKPAGE